MKNFKPLFSSQSTGWLTPIDLFEEIRDVFNIELDPCADFENPLPVKTHIMPPSNGLLEEWNFNTFINPPYDTIELWVTKTIEQSEKYKNKAYVMLLPSRTDRPWFRKVLSKAVAVCFIHKRLRFSNAKNNAPFPSLIAVFQNDGAGYITDEQLKMLEKHGYVI
jgi:site-specific DNA-methyltransferase (adenine-specific)